MIHQEVSFLFPEGHLDVGSRKKKDLSKHDIAVYKLFTFINSPLTLDRPGHIICQAVLFRSVHSDETDVGPTIVHHIPVTVNPKKINVQMF